MKRKLLLPLFAVVFALASAFASVTSQTGWYKPFGAPVTSGTITTPPAISGIECVSVGENICKVSNADAYDTYENAVAGGVDGLLRYDDN